MTFLHLKNLEIKDFILSTFSTGKQNSIMDVSIKIPKNSKETLGKTVFFGANGIRKKKCQKIVEVSDHIDLTLKGL